MLNLALASAVILIIAIVMIMTGRGGGVFYVPVLVACGFAMHHAAAIGQCILFSTGISAALVFQKHKFIDWKLALAIDPPTDVMALVGGYYAYLLPGKTLKLIFGVLLVAAGFLMLHPADTRLFAAEKRFGFWHRQFGESEYTVNLWLAIPITAASGLFAGMTGISGGSFKVPLMVLACGVPMHIAVGTSTVMVAATAFMGFMGHSAAGGLDGIWKTTVWLCAAALVGGLLGGRFALRTNPRNLKRLFAYTTLAAAGFMFANAYFSGSN